jgi:hypothetical protein
MGPSAILCVTLRLKMLRIQRTKHYIYVIQDTSFPTRKVKEPYYEEVPVWMASKDMVELRDATIYSRHTLRPCWTR